MRKFNPNLAAKSDGTGWVAAYRERRGYGESFGYEAEHIANSNIRDVWTAVQQLEYFEDWFFGSGSSEDVSGFPMEFGPGQRTPGGRATIIDCSLRDGIVFRQNDAFFHLTLKDYGPTACLMKLRCFDFYERRPGFISSIFIAISNNGERDQSGDEAATRRRLMRLGDLAEDLRLFGHPVNGRTVNGKTLGWVSWNHSNGVLNVLPDRQGNRRFDKGQVWQQGKVAYIVRDGDEGQPERHYIENWYIDFWYEARILDVRKNHGDHVKDGDRLLLVEQLD